MCSTCIYGKSFFPTLQWNCFRSSPFCGEGEVTDRLYAGRQVEHIQDIQKMTVCVYGKW